MTSALLSGRRVADGGPVRRPRTETTGAPSRCSRGSTSTIVGNARVALSDSGTLIYLAGSARSRSWSRWTRAASRSLFARRRTTFCRPPGRRTAAVLPSTSPWRRAPTSGCATWRPARQPLPTSDKSTTVWTFDGRRLVYTSARSGRAGVWCSWRTQRAGEKLFEVPNVNITEAALARDSHTWSTERSRRTSSFPSTSPADRTPKAITTDRFTRSTRRSAGRPMVGLLVDEGAAPQVMVWPFPGPGAQHRFPSTAARSPCGHLTARRFSTAAADHWSVRALSPVQRSLSVRAVSCSTVPTHRRGWAGTKR